MSGKTKKRIRICLIGNSHAGCFKTGWDAIASSYPAVDISFYPHSGMFFGLFRVDSSRKLLWIDDEFVKDQFNKYSGNDGDIDFGLFDFCLIVGGILDWNYPTASYSKQVIETMAEDYIISAHSTVLLKKIRELSEIPITIIPSPYGARRGTIEPSDKKNRVGGNKMLNAVLWRKHKAEHVMQPDVTLISPFISKLEYAAGERLTGASLVPDAPQDIIDDLVHMNAAYGALFLSEILADKGHKPKKLKLPKPDGHLPFAERAKGG